MDTKVCEYILDIARHRSITKAADALSLSQSALSQCLIRVEKEMGAKLFYRRKSSLTPTEAGKLYLDAATKMVETKSRLRADISAIAHKRCIRIGVTSIWGMDIMMELLPVFREKFPDVTLELKNGNFAELSDGYLRGKYDMAVTSAIHDDSLPGKCVKLRDEELKLIINANHSFALRHMNEEVLPRSIIRDELADVEVIRTERGATNHEIENQLFSELGIQTITVCELGDHLALVRLVEGGVGYAVVSGDYASRGENTKSWSIDPGLYRVNAIFVHPSLEVGTPEKFLIGLIKSHQLFSK